MHLSDMPTLVAIPFGNNAGSGYIRTIPVPSQIGITPGAASFHDGFPPLTFTPLGSGGAYVNGEDINGILNFVSAWTRWLQAGSALPFNSAFATAIGGYPELACVQSTAVAGLVWQNTVDGNLTDPDGGSPVGWVQVGPPAASLAEVRAGTVANKYVSPKTLHDMASAIDAETIALPGGFLLKTKLVTLPTGSNVETVAFTWANPFPSALMGFSGTPNNGGNPGRAALTCTLQSMNTNGGTVQCDTGDSSFPISNSVKVSVTAIGK